MDRSCKALIYINLITYLMYSRTLFYSSLFNTAFIFVCIGFILWGLIELTQTLSKTNRLHVPDKPVVQHTCPMGKVDLVAVHTVYYSRKY